MSLITRRRMTEADTIEALIVLADAGVEEAADELAAYANRAAAHSAPAAAKVMPPDGDRFEWYHRPQTKSYYAPGIGMLETKALLPDEDK